MNKLVPFFPILFPILFLAAWQLRPAPPITVSFTASDVDTPAPPPPLSAGNKLVAAPPPPIDGAVTPVLAKKALSSPLTKKNHSELLEIATRPSSDRSEQQLATFLLKNDPRTPPEILKQLEVALDKNTEK